MEVNKRDFQAEFQKKVISLGVPSALLEGQKYFKHENELRELVEPFLVHNQITKELFNIELFTAIVKKTKLNLFQISRVLNYLAQLSPKELDYSLKTFVNFHTAIDTIIKNYNSILAPHIKHVEDEAKKYDADQKEAQMKLHKAIDPNAKG